MVNINLIEQVNLYDARYIDLFESSEIKSLFSKDDIKKYKESIKNYLEAISKVITLINTIKDFNLKAKIEYAERRFNELLELMTFRLGYFSDVNSWFNDFINFIFAKPESEKRIDRLTINYKKVFTSKNLAIKKMIEKRLKENDELLRVNKKILKFFPIENTFRFYTEENLPVNVMKDFFFNKIKKRKINELINNLDESISKLNDSIEALYEINKLLYGDYKGKVIKLFENYKKELSKTSSELSSMSKDKEKVAQLIQIINGINSLMESLSKDALLNVKNYFGEKIDFIGNKLKYFDKGFFMCLKLYDNLYAIDTLIKSMKL